MKLYDRNKIYAMDCIEGMNRYPEGFADVIVTSPPYNMGVGYNGYHDSHPRDAYLDWLEHVAIACKRLLSDDGSFFLNLGSSLKDPWMSMDVAARVRNHFVLQNTIHWVKSVTIDSPQHGEVSVGHYKPINSKRFHHDAHEYIFHFTKSGSVQLDKLSIGVEYADKTNIKRWKTPNGSDRRDRGNIWYIPYETVCKSKDHPCAFPVALPKMCIQDHGVRKGMVVVDPFMGRGSTAIAAVDLGVDFVGFDIDPDYVDGACTWVHEFMLSRSADMT